MSAPSKHAVELLYYIESIKHESQLCSNDLQTIGPTHTIYELQNVFQLSNLIDFSSLRRMSSPNSSIS